MICQKPFNLIHYVTGSRGLRKRIFHILNWHISRLTMLSSFNKACLSFSLSPNGKAHKRSIRRQEREGSPKCYHCDGDENITVEHFLVSCSKFEEIRSELLSQLRGELEAIGERGFQVWQRFTASSPACQSQIILGAQSFGALEDEAIDHFRAEYVARAWSERIVIWGRWWE